MIEDTDFRAPRGLDRALFQKLADCRWIREHNHLIIGGPTSVGKSWLACALGHKACREGYSVLYRRAPRLFADLATARNEGRLPKLMAAIERTRLLIIDDWCPEPLTPEQRPPSIIAAASTSASTRSVTPLGSMISISPAGRGSITGALFFSSLLISSGASGGGGIDRRAHCAGARRSFSRQARLMGGKAGVRAAGRQQRRVGSGLDDPSRLHHQDQVGVLNGR